MAVVLLSILLLSYLVNAFNADNIPIINGTSNGTVDDRLRTFQSENIWNISTIVKSAATENSSLYDDDYEDNVPDFFDSDNLNVSISDVDWEIVTKFLKLSTKSVVQSLNLVDLIKVVNISDECRSGLETFLVSLSKWETWAVRMADASGKIPGGVLEGTTLDVGSFEECLKIRVHSDDDEVEQFRGRYCLVGYKSPLVTRYYQEPFLTHRQNYIATYGKPPEWIKDFIKRSGNYIKLVSMYLGTCVPSTCSKDDVMKIATHVVSPLGLEVHIPSCQVDEPKHLTTNGIIALGFIGVITGLCVLGTIIDIIGRFVLEDQQSLRTKCFLLYLLRLFSLYLNTETFFGESKGSTKLSFFNGMRFITYAWIVLDHSWIILGEWSLLAYRNFLGVDDVAKNKLVFTLIETTDAAVDTFFFISGFLVVYTTWKKLDKTKGKLNVFKFMIQKIWRLSPALGVTMAIFLVYDHYGSGPIYEASRPDFITKCYTQWYWNFLYINNWWNPEDMCLPHTWFLAALMQLHLIGVILLIVCYRSPTAGFIIGSAIVISSSVYIALVNIWNNFPMPTYFGLRDMEFKGNLNNQIQFQTYAHINSYLIGMALGYMFLKYNEKKIRKHYAALGWIVAVGLAFYVIEGKYIAGEYREAVAFYSSINKTAWCLSLGWVTHMCATGNGGVINRFLSWNGFTSLSNISYLAYLLHVLIIYYRNSTMRERIQYGEMELVFEFLLVLVTGSLLAVAAYITVEMPFSAIGNLIFRR